MQRFNLAAAAGCIALVSAVLAPVANADEWNQKTVLTFSGPVEIPGVHLTGWGTLPAGTYVFKLLDSASDRHIVQIFNKDETVVYATILAIPNYRLQATDKTVITFSERPAGEPEALRAWFYPGHNWGEEFVYPKAKAMALAKASNVPVLYTPAEIPVEVAEPIQSAAAPVVVEMKRAPIMAIQPTGEDVVLAAVVTAPPPEPVQEASAPTPSSQPAAAPDPAPAATLPATASSTPLFGLLGLLALGGAFALRAVGTRLQ
jgi:hypothetical protein